MIQPSTTIYMLGGLRVEQGSRIVTRFRTRKTAALLAYLAIFKGRMHTREELADLFWPDSDPEDARASLRTALNSLRNQLNPGGSPSDAFLLSDRTGAQLRHDSFSTDVVRFEKALSEARTASNPKERIEALCRAAQQYCGELLPGFYEEWIAQERSRLAEAYQCALNRIVSHVEAEGDLERALEYTLRSISADPTHEQAYQTAIRIYQKAGRNAEAVRQYRQLERVLRDQVGAEPSEETRALVRSQPGGYRSTVMVKRARNRTPTRPMDLRVHHPEPERIVREAPRLPVALTPFFGRDAELSRLARLLTDFVNPASSAGGRNQRARLITLVGPGGSGKTRLALELASDLEHQFSGAIWFAPLAGISDSRGIPNAILDAMDLANHSLAEWSGAITALLVDKPGLIILDNFEHLTEDGCKYVRELLSCAPSLTCLVTSQRRLGLEGERAFPILPLAVPDANCAQPAKLLEFPSIRLFSDRAQAARPDFQVTARNAAAVGELCRRLDGLPLALELAASWAQVLTPGQMLERSRQSPELPSRLRHGAASRQASMRRTIDWSYSLLPAYLQAIFVRLSVFRGGWSAATAAAVCRDLPCGWDGDMLTELTRLADSSLIYTEQVTLQRGSEIRFRMLETLREFARDQLTETQRENLSLLHAEYFASITAAYAAEQLPDHSDALDPNYDDMSAAVTWAIDGGVEVHDLAIQMAIDMCHHWLWRGRLAEGRRHLEQVLAGAVTNTLATANALKTAGTLCFYLQDHEASLQFHNRQLDMLRALGDEQEAAACLTNIGLAEHSLGRFAAARSLHEQCLEGLRKWGPARSIPAALGNLADAVASLGDRAGARELYWESLKGYEALGSGYGVAMCFRSLGELALQDRDLPSVKWYYECALDFQCPHGPPEAVASMLLDIANIHDALGQSVEAATRRAESDAILAATAA